MGQARGTGSGRRAVLAWLLAAAQVSVAGTKPDSTAGYGRIGFRPNGEIESVELADSGSDGKIGRELQSGLAAVSRAGGTVFLPAGTYDIGKEGVSISTGTDRTGIVGRGSGVTILLFREDGSETGGAPSAIRLGAKTEEGTSAGQLRYLTLKGFTLRRAGPANGQGPHADGIRCWMVRRSDFEDLSIEGFAVGIMCRDVSDFNTFRGVSTRDCSSAGISLSNQCNGNTFRECDLLQTVGRSLETTLIPGSGLRIDYESVKNVVSESRFHNFNSSAGDAAVVIGEGCSACAVRDCYFENCEIGVKADAGDSYPLKSVSVEGNYFFACRNASVSGGDSSSKQPTIGLTVASNSFDGYKPSGAWERAAGVRIGRTVRDYLLLNNTYSGYEGPLQRAWIADPHAEGAVLEGDALRNLQQQR